MAKNDLTLHDLAELISTSFTEERKHTDAQFGLVFKRLDEHDKRFDSHDNHFRQINTRLDVIEIDLADVRKELISIRQALDEIVTHREFDSLEKRVTRLERQLNLKK